MANTPHKGSELNNVKETWEQNEREAASRAGGTEEPALPGNDLQQVIKEEAAEYERSNNADNVLPGERATVDDSTGENE